MTRLLFFGRLRDVAGASEQNIELPSDIATIADLRRWLGAENDVLGEALNARSVRVAVDRLIASDDCVLVRGAAEVAFMPPLSGG
ncbi:MAG: MoaD/ThiS family protein [Hyphomonadaceae bacterium]